MSREFFDKENCEGCLNEVLHWDEDQHFKEVRKIYGKRNYKDVENQKYTYSKLQDSWVAHPNDSLCKDPRKESLKNWRNRTRSCRTVRVGNENKVAKKETQKRFRARMRNKMAHQDYHLPTPHEYKTYGWETW